MIKLALFDVGDTLIHNREPLPHVHDALQAVASFETADGNELALGVVSDYQMPAEIGNEAQIAAMERTFVELLHNAGLDSFFTPPEQRITLSTRAGVNKPDRRIFELAAQRSETGATLKECLFVTENRAHLAKCREYRMAILCYGDGAHNGLAFTDWSEAPLLIARLVAPDNGENLQAALAVRLVATHGLEITQCEFAPGRDRVRGRAKAWVQLQKLPIAELRDVHVQLPVDFSARLDQHGHLVSVESGEPDREGIAEASAQVEALVSNKQVAMGTSQGDFGTTHRVEVDEHGRRYLKRQRFSAR